MKLLIGGKNRNIYMRKDGSAYYKSGGQQVDVTHMFKKNGGGLKKQYIKGGTTEAKFTELKKHCNDLYEKLKALHDKLEPHTFTDEGSRGTFTTKEFIENILENYDKDYNLKKFANEINKAVIEGYTDSPEVAENYKKLIEQLRKVSENIKDLTTDVIKDDLNGLSETPVFESQSPSEIFKGKKEDFLKKLKFFDTDNRIEAINQIGIGTETKTPTTKKPKKKKETETETETEDAEQTEDANSVTISTSVPQISALSKFSGNIDTFDKEFLDLAHLLISVINTLRKTNKIIIKSENPNEIKNQVTKLNALITLFAMSDKNTSANTGVFLKNSFKKDVIEAKHKDVYLEITDEKNENNEYSVSKKDKSLSDETILKIFSVIGEICKLDSKATAFGIAKTQVAQNLRDFLNSNSHEAIKITE